MSAPHAFTCMCSACIAEMQRPQARHSRLNSWPHDRPQPTTALVRAFSEPPSFSNTPESESWRDYHTVDRA